MATRICIKDGIFRLAIETLDLEIPLNPFEEFHLPIVLVEQGDIFCSETVVVRVVNKTTVQLR